VVSEWTEVVLNPSCLAVNVQTEASVASIAEVADAGDAGDAEDAGDAGDAADAVGAAGATKEFQEQMSCFGDGEAPGDAGHIAKFAASDIGCHSTQVAGLRWAGRCTLVVHGCHAVAN
jgi:hypothetical protein